MTGWTFERRLRGWRYAVIWIGWIRCSLSWAQQTIGVWTFQQWGMGLDKKDRWQLVAITQPRFSHKGWETIILLGKLGYRIHPQHAVFLGGQWVEFYDPRRFSQRRFFQRWQWTPSTYFSLTTTVEERWQNGRLIEALLRPLGRYRIGVGAFWLNYTNEIFFSFWGPQTSWRFYPRQLRIWLSVSYPRTGNWQVEVGYLNISIPKAAPRHRLWIATRLYFNPFKEEQPQR